MPREIERKFLVADDGWRAFADTGRRLRQAYLTETDKAVVRVRIEDGRAAFLTVKSAEAGLSRQEFEYPIPTADAGALLALCEGPLLDKTRHLVAYAGRAWEVDVYAGDNAGLVVAEIELADEGEAVAEPPWLGREVTAEARYYASRLALNPYSAWPEQDRRGA